MAASIFHYFGRLPPELRRQVYYEYLSPYDAPAVYLYNRNFILRFTDPEGEDERYAGISHEPLVQVPTPALLAVSAEARAATLSWASRQGISLRYRHETPRGYVLTRAYDPVSDALYVSREMWEEFCELPWESVDGMEAMAASIRHLALPAFTAYYSFIELGGYLLEWFPGLEVLSAVWGELPEVRYARTKRVPPRLRDADGGVNGDGDGDDDGTDTGVDPLTGEREVQIAAEVQPVWRLEPETDEMVRMCVRDPADGSLSWEEGELGMWMDELEEAFMTVELPEHMYDPEDDVLLVKFKPMRAVNVRV